MDMFNRILLNNIIIQSLEGDLIMNRKEKIKQFIEEQHKEPMSTVATSGVTAAMVANALGIWRNDASKDLNLLVKEGYLKKQGARPVFFYLNTSEVQLKKHASDDVKETFKKIIGYDGSLRLQVQLAKAAAAYPPCGMHTLIIGDTGVGKTLFAEEIWNHFSSLRADKNSPFVVFNCAEYADNPQLLLSQLFGYEKGAFTGADAAKPGLLERANGGVLLLDEIHRLPSTGQEMFFTVIDKGIYRRLGSTTDNHIELMIIGATTENIDSNLLDTFKRRFPMIIEIPSLVQRPLKEKLDLIVHFLAQESKKLKAPIEVTEEALKYMTAYKGRANIGDLKNKLQICCAKSHLFFISSEENISSENSLIKINVDNLPRDMAVEYVKKDEIEVFFKNMSLNRGIIINPSMADVVKYSLINEDKVALDTTKEVSDIPFSKELSIMELKEDYGSISEDSLIISKEIVNLAIEELGETYSKDTITTLAFHLEQIRSFAKAGRIFVNKSEPEMRRPYDKEIAFILKITPIITERLDIQLLESEITLLALILKQHSTDDFSKNTMNKCFGLLIALNGTEKATESANFINRMYKANVANGLNIQENVTDDKLLADLSIYIQKSNHGKGVIIVTDSIKLVALKKKLFQMTGIPCSIINKSGKNILIEAAKAIIIASDSTSMYDITKSIGQISFFGNLLKPYLRAKQ